ncbi:MAG: hypothetical protein MUP98_00175 [Candidatus Aminicenantes bacterium]|nr:hypothetical protein [Candidatus Aminicenantes bacterium]
MAAKVKKTLTWIGLCFVILIAFSLMIRAVFNYSTGKKLENTLQKMKSDGIHLAIQEMEPQCDREDNAAISWKAGEAVFSLNKEERTLLGDSIQDLFYLRPLGTENKQRLRKLISENQRVIQFIQEAAEKSCFKYVENWDRPPSEFELPDILKMMNVIRLVGIDSFLKGESGQTEDAIALCLAGIHFLRTYLQEPFLMNYLVALANMKQLVICLQRIIQEKDISTQFLAAVFQELDSSHWHKNLEWKSQTERVFGIEASYRILDGDLSFINGKFSTKVYFWMFRPILKSGIIKVLKTYDRYVKTLSLPYYEYKDAHEDIIRGLNRPSLFSETMKLIFPNLSTVKFRLATLDAVLHSTRLGIACKIYKNENGEYPNTLSELVPDFMNEELLDPFSGEPFVFRREDTGIIIYSVGSNGKDDGGRGTWMITQLVMEKDDDWSWKERTIKQIEIRR